MLQAGFCHVEIRSLHFEVLDVFGKVDIPSSDLNEAAAATDSVATLAFKILGRSFGTADPRSLAEVK